MKRFFTLCLFLITGTLFSSQTILVDPYFSPYAGSADLMTAQDLLIMGEDRWIERGGRNSTGKIWGRTAEQFLFWYNLNMMAAVTQHEVFGHGYRLRELGVTPKRYTVTPWGGATYFKIKSSFKVGEMLAVTVAGLEAESILARDYKMEWIGKGTLDGRLSSTYFQAQQSLFWYTLITQLGRLKNEEISDGNDIDGYIKLQNVSYTDDHLSIGKLTRWSIFNWLDPMTFYAYYAFYYYIATGKSFDFPMIPLSENIRYLPNVKIGYAPYAPEAYLENFFSIGGKPLYFYFKGGKRSFGVGVGYDHIFTGRRGTLGFRFDGWNQGVFLTTATVGDLEETGTAYHPSLKKRRWGGALSFRGTLNLFSHFALFAELGGKTSGYLPGYRLGKEIVTRVGIQIGPNALQQTKQLK